MAKIMASPRAMLKSWSIVAVLALQTHAFSLYPTVDPDSLATALNISAGCLDAL